MACFLPFLLFIPSALAFLPPHLSLLPPRLAALPPAADFAGADFPASIELGADVCAAVRRLQQPAPGDAAPETEETLSAVLTAMLGHADGARGFFVRWLTDGYIQDQAAVYDEALPEVLRQALAAAPVAVVSPLAVMNLVMPTAMAVHYESKWDKKAAAASAATSTRAAQIIEELPPGPMRQDVEQRMRQARRSLAGEDGDVGDWPAFWDKWGYTGEQKKGIQAVLEDVLESGEEAA